MENTTKMLYNLYMHLKDDAYKNFEYSNADNITEWYCGRDLCFLRQYQTENHIPLVPWNETELYPNQLDFFDKIIDLCPATRKSFALYFYACSKIIFGT